MILLIEYLIAQEVYQREQTMIKKFKKLLFLLEQQHLSTPSYTCESALLMGF